MDLKELEQTTRPCAVEMMGKFTFKIILTQGLNRQIRRMCEALDCKVVTLKRIRIMNVKLGDLKEGTYREISKKLMQHRLKRGEMRMNIPEPFILENEAGEIISIEKRVQDESHEIIETLMVLTNECVAKRFFSLSSPYTHCGSFASSFW